MRSERGQVPCFANPEKMCDCPLLPINAEFINNLGKRDRMLRSAIQRNGYDRVTPGLIKELIVHPNGGFYTEAFDRVCPFPPEMREIRQRILDFWAVKIRDQFPNPDELPCPNMRNK